LAYLLVAKESKTPPRSSTTTNVAGEVVCTYPEIEELIDMLSDDGKDFVLRGKALLEELCQTSSDSLDYEDLFCRPPVSSGSFEQTDSLPLDATEPRLEVETSNTDNAMAVANAREMSAANVPARRLPASFDMSQDLPWDEDEMDNAIREVLNPGQDSTPPISSGSSGHTEPLPLDAADPRSELEGSNTNNPMAVASTGAIPEESIPADLRQEISLDEDDIDIAAPRRKFMKLSASQISVDLD
jgi:hypothetical protein